MEIKFANVTVIQDLYTPLEKTILKDATFKIEDRKITAFVGPSNSGKTSIAELIDALIYPTSGCVTINGKCNDGRNIHKINDLRVEIGYVFKNPYDMFFNKTVKSEISFGMKYFKYRVNKIGMRTEEALKLVGLSNEYLKKIPYKLSLSDAKKVALASTLVFNPKVIILDEPTIGLTLKERDELSRLLIKLRNKYNKTIIILTKDTDFAYKTVDNVFLMANTHIITSGGIELLRETTLLDVIGLKEPDIVKFTSLANKKDNVKINNYKDIKDLIKAVYRNVF